MKLNDDQEALTNSLLNGLETFYDGVIIPSKDDGLARTAELLKILHDDIMNKLSIKGKRMMNFSDKINKINYLIKAK